MILDRDTLALAGAAYDGPPFPVARVSHDSRAVAPGDLFVGLKTDRRNGSDFHAQAAAGGAALLLLDRAVAGCPVPHAVAADPMDALVRLARIARARTRATVVSMTGSSGKTTTKEMLAAILGARGRTFVNRGNYNNLLGVSLSLVEAPEDAEFLVLEAGTSAPGEIALLADLIRPELAILTIVGHSHLEFFGTPDAVFAEKIELVNRLVGRRLACLNALDPRIRRFRPPADMRVSWYGERPPDPKEPAPDLEGLAFRQGEEGVSFLARVRATGEETPVSLAVPGRHMMMNALAALCAARALGVPLESSAAALASFRPVGGRLDVRRARGVLVVDDSYNANPDSVRAALLAARDMRVAGRRIAALGDMLELGDAGPDLHRATGRAVVETGCDRFVAVGPLMALAAEAAVAAGMPADAVERFATSSDARAILSGLAPGDLLLVKGSHGMRMERLVEGF